jgi:hypothetical protein
VDRNLPSRVKVTALSQSPVFSRTIFQASPEAASTRTKDVTFHVTGEIVSAGFSESH